MLSAGYCIVFVSTFVSFRYQHKLRNRDDEKSKGKVGRHYVGTASCTPADFLTTFLSGRAVMLFLRMVVLTSLPQLFFFFSFQLSCVFSSYSFAFSPFASHHYSCISFITLFTGHKIPFKRNLTLYLIVLTHSLLSFSSFLSSPSFIHLQIFK